MAPTLDTRGRRGKRGKKGWGMKSLNFMPLNVAEERFVWMTQGLDKKENAAARLNPI
jgi:hypothetical protein